MFQGGPFPLEFLSLSITCQPFCTFCLCLFYRPPSSPVSIFDNFCTTLQILNPAKFHSFVIIGDFNVNFCNKNHHLFSYIDDSLCNFSLTQVVSSHTHISPSGTSSLLDYVLLPDLQFLLYCATIPALSTSDHLGISLALAWNPPCAKVPKPRKVWLYSLGDFEKACSMIQATDWDTILSNDVDDAAKQWCDSFLAIMEECTPRYQLQKKHNLLWLTINIKKLIRKRNALFRKAKRINKNSDFIHYKAIRNRVVKSLRIGKQLNKLAHVDLKHFWKYVKFLNKNKETVPTLQQGVYTASNDKEKAEMFNKFLLAAGIPQSFHCQRKCIVYNLHFVI